MKLSDAEKQILRDCCKEKGISPKALHAILKCESEAFFSNESQKVKIVPEMIKAIQYYAKNNE